MPPPGGYAPIRWERVPQKKLLNGWYCLGIYVLGTIWGTYKVLAWKHYLRKIDVEKHDTFLAMQPFIRAEQDRGLLRQIWENREEETKLMKNHEGWSVGTLYGDPIFKTKKKEAFPEYSFPELYIHRPFSDHWEYAWPDQWI